MAAADRATACPTNTRPDSAMIAANSSSIARSTSVVAVTRRAVTCRSSTGTPWKTSVLAWRRSAATSAAPLRSVTIAFSAVTICPW
jgi:hypothetical protein